MVSSSSVVVGSGITLSKDGDIFATGVTTTGSLVSSGAISGTTGTFTVGTSKNAKFYAASHNDETDLGAGLGFSRQSDGAELISGIFGHSNSGLGVAARDHITFLTGGTSDVSDTEERIRIDSSGRLMIGTNDASQFHSSSDDFVISRDGHAGITIDSTSSHNSSVFFADGPTGSEAYRGYVQYSHNLDELRLGAAGVDQVQITSGNVEIVDGDLVMGTSGHGISFAITANTSASGASTSSELFDDYEEGTWTPTASESGNNVALSNNTGRYVKVGAMVYAFFRINVDTTSAGGHFIVSGLPFTTINVNPACGGVAKDYQIQFYKNTGQNLNANNASGKDFRGCAIYQAG